MYRNAVLNDSSAYATQIECPSDIWLFRNAAAGTFYFAGSMALLAIGTSGLSQQDATNRYLKAKRRMPWIT